MSARNALSRTAPALAGLALLAVGVAAGLFIAGAGQAPPAPPATPSPPPDFARLKDLAERLLSPPDPMAVADGPRAELVPGGLPPNLPVDVPLPEGARLVGSLARPALKGDGPSWVVVVDTPGSVADAVAFYRDALMARGWTPPPGIAKGGGFQPSLGPGATAFCRGPGGPWLNLTALGRPGDTAEIRLNIQANPGPCGQPPPVGKPAPPGLDRLPALYPPRGVLVTGPGFSGGPNRWTSDATALTELGVAELEAHFGAQLKAAGWTRLGGAAQGPVAWSLWSLPGEGNWQGLLYIAQVPGQNSRWLHLRVEAGG